MTRSNLQPFMPLQVLSKFCWKVAGLKHALDLSRGKETFQLFPCLIQCYWCSRHRKTAMKKKIKTVANKWYQQQTLLWCHATGSSSTAADVGFSKGVVAGVELRRREDRGVVGADGCGEGCFPPNWVCTPPQDIFWILFMEIALFGAFWGIFKSLYSYVCVPFSYQQGRFAMTWESANE